MVAVAPPESRISRAFSPGESPVFTDDPSDREGCGIAQNWTSYCSNNPINYVDPTGMWEDNHDGTYTAQEGDTLWDLYGSDWKDDSGYTGDPEKLEVGTVVGEKKADVNLDEGKPGVEMNFFPSSEKIHDYANAVEKEADTFLVGGHGSVHGFYDRNGNFLNPEVLSDLIASNPLYSSSDTIKLLSCNTGGDSSMGKNYAQRLANAMGTGISVSAPDSLVWYSPSGSYTAAPRNPITKGKAWFRRGEFNWFTGK